MNRLGSLPNLTPVALSTPTAGIENAWLIWQIADSAFPTGSFAHSGGLESAWQSGVLASASEFSAFLRTLLTQWAHGSLPYMTSAFDRPARLVELDARMEAFLSNHVASRASRLQGQALLAAATRIFFERGRADSNETQRFHLDSPHQHYAPTFGALTHALEIERSYAARLFMFIALRGLVSAAVRLGVVGPLEGQRVQAAMAPHLEALLATCAELPVEQAAQTAPLVDVAHGVHDRLYSRLFQT